MLENGLQLGPYTILSPLGKGGMGEVYVGMDSRLGREVAIKILPEHLAKDTAAVRRFQKEAKVLAALSHPNILTIYDVGSHGGISFVVTELLKGETLRQRISRATISWEEAVAVALAVVEGLSAAHKNHFVHRDLKPENIFLTTGGGIKILDFGLARYEKTLPIGDLDSALTGSVATQEGVVLGSLPYMSPEQVSGKVADERSDIFSLGSVLYEMLVSVRPFSGNNAAELLAAILKEAAPPPSSRARDLPRQLDEVIRRCLEKDPNLRFQSVGELSLALSQILKRSPVPDQQEQPELSVAVLYFENLSPANEDEYFRDGVTEDLITELSKIKRLKVFSRSSVFTYRDKPLDISELAVQLRAVYILEGSIRRAGDRLRITARLVDTQSTHAIWNERYDRKVQDIFELQDELARSIAHALQITLSRREQDAIASKPAKNPEAYDYYLRGRSHLRRKTRQDFDHALKMFEKATDIEPGFALAHASLAYVCSGIHVWYENKGGWDARATASADHALSLEPQLPEALVAKAMLAWGNQKYEEAIEYTRVAISIRPQCDGAYWILGASLFAMDRFQEAADLLDRAIEAAGDDNNV